MRPAHAGFLLTAVLTMFGLGCATTVVKKNPGPHEHGLRYYRPKPYLLVDRALGKHYTSTEPRQFVKTGEVDITLKQLPDFSEEYAIRSRAGIGFNQTKVTLADGWHLQEVTVNVESRATEFVQALTKILQTEPKLITGEKDVNRMANEEDLSPPESPLTLRCVAQNVPLGYYESVIGPGPDGKRRLFGWRYVGFAPFANCPLDLAGSTKLCCHEVELYGIVADGDRMSFRKLSELAVEEVAVKISAPAPTSEAPAPVSAGEAKQGSKAKLGPPTQPQTEFAVPPKR